MDFNEPLLELPLKSGELLFQFGDFGAESRDFVFEAHKAFGVRSIGRCVRRSYGMAHLPARRWRYA
jgi:hypothetical protein